MEGQRAQTVVVRCSETQGPLLDGGRLDVVAGPAVGDLGRLVADDVDEKAVADPGQDALVADGDMPAARLSDLESAEGENSVGFGTEHLPVDDQQGIRHGDIGAGGDADRRPRQCRYVALAVLGGGQLRPVRIAILEHDVGDPWQIGDADHVPLGADTGSAGVVADVFIHTDEDEAVAPVAEPCHGCGLPARGAIELGMKLHGRGRESAGGRFDHDVAAARHHGVARADGDARRGGHEQLSGPEPKGGELQRRRTAGPRSQEPEEGGGSDAGDDARQQNCPGRYGHVDWRVARDAFCVPRKQAEERRVLPALIGIVPGAEAAIEGRDHLLERFGAPGVA